MPAPPIDLLDSRLQVEASLAGFPGRMTVPEGWDTGRTAIGEHMVYFVQRGSSRMETGDMARAIGPGTCAVIPPRTAFRMRGERGSRPTILRCRLSLVRRGEAVAWSDRALVRLGAWDLEPVVALLTEEAGGDQPQREERLRSLAVLLLTGMARGDAASSGLDARQRAALADLLDRHRAHGLEPRDLAAHLGLTLDYFTRRFRLAYGMPPRRWLVRERVRAACVLLAEGHSELETVARELGYADIKLFGRQFTQVMGVPPGRWRQQREIAGA